MAEIGPNPEPLVSIVIPFFETYAEYLTECLESVRRQTYARWELVVVDDGSPTDIAEIIVRQFGDSRMRAMRHARNRGQAAGRNSGILSSRGPLIMPLDCDDRLAPTHVEKLVAALSEHPECGAAYSDFRLFGEVDREQRFPERDTRWLLREQWIPHPGTIVRRELWESAHGYCEDEALRAGNEDWDYFLSLAEVGLKATRVPELLYGYRQHGGSITSSQFACAEHRMREFMYVRHQRLFDQFHMRRTFLAKGYRISGRAFWQRGQFARGIWLLLLAVWLSPSSSLGAAWRAILRTAGMRPLAEARA